MEAIRSQFLHAEFINKIQNLHTHMQRDKHMHL